MTVQFRCGQGNGLPLVLCFLYLLITGHLKKCFIINKYFFLKENKNLLRYSMQLSMLKQLLNLKLLSETEYEMIRKKLMKDYGIVSDITA